MAKLTAFYDRHRTVIAALVMALIVTGAYFYDRDTPNIELFWGWLFMLFLWALVITGVLDALGFGPYADRDNAD